MLKSRNWQLKELIKEFEKEFAKDFKSQVRLMQAEVWIDKKLFETALANFELGYEARKNE